MELGKNVLQFLFCFWVIYSSPRRKKPLQVRQLDSKSFSCPEWLSPVVIRLFLKSTSPRRRTNGDTLSITNKKKDIFTQKGDFTLSRQAAKRLSVRSLAFTQSGQNQNRYVTRKNTIQLFIYLIIIKKSSVCFFSDRLVNWLGFLPLHTPNPFSGMLTFCFL